MNYLGITLLVIVVIIAATLLAVHIGFRAPRLIEHSSPAAFGLAYEETHIQMTAGKQLFAWWLSVPRPALTLIIVHGWGGNAELMLLLVLPINRAGDGCKGDSGSLSRENTRTAFNRGRES